jgi:hypothetical protein
MRSNQFVACFAVSSVLAFSGVATADTFELIGGGSFTGKLLNDRNAEIWRIETTDGIEIEMPKNKFSPKSTRIGDREKQYIESISAKDDSIEAHREAVKECITNNQKLLADAHYERIVELDPADKQSWAALGYRPDKYGNWLHGDRIQKSLGLVKKYEERGWTTPQARAIVEVEQKQKMAKVEISKKIERALKNLGNPKLGREATDFLRNLNDPLAIDLIVSKLKKELDQGKNGEFYMQVLEQMPGTTASASLIDLAMNSNNQTIVDRSIELLMRTEQSQELAILAFLNALGSKEVKTKDRAGSNLNGIADIRCTYQLINTLHSTIIRTQNVGQTNSVTSDGGVSASTPSVITTKHQYNHEPVLATLTQLTGENFGFDKQKWRQWYAEKFADTNLDLRRDW